jgi:hypothetical protein
MTDKIENCLSAPALEWGKLQRVRKNFGKYGNSSFPAASLKRDKAFQNCTDFRGPTVKRDGE